MKTVEKYMLYCQKILPLVYDDALSYYETLCKVVAKMNETIDAVNNISADILREANAYTDEQIAEAKKDIDDKINEVNALIRVVQEDYDSFTRTVDAKIALLRSDFADFETKIDNEILGINARTDYAIEQNNIYLLDELSKSIAKLNVINFFTGLEVTIQEMFDTLAQLHITDPLTYTDYANKNITYSNLSLLNIDYTELVLHGKQIIP